MLLGVTGQMGSGKSTAAAILRELGAAVVDADRIGREVVERSAPLKKKLAGAFGRDVLTPMGRLRRKLVAERAFADPAAKRRLDRLVHPYLLKDLRRRVGEMQRRSPIVVVDAALLLDWNLDREVDFVLVVHASWPTRLRRLKAAGYSEEDARARRRRQLPFGEYRRRADRVILNNGRREDLRRKLTALWPALLRKAVDNG